MICHLFNYVEDEVVNVSELPFVCVLKQANDGFDQSFSWRHNYALLSLLYSTNFDLSNSIEPRREPTKKAEPCVPNYRTFVL